MRGARPLPRGSGASGRGLPGPRPRSGRAPARPGTFRLALLLGLAASLAPGCSGGSGNDARESAAVPSPASRQAGGEPDAAAAQAREGDLPLVLFLGDSITAGYGLSGGEAFPALVEEDLAARDRPARVVNAGVSGDTTSGGLSRLDWLLRQDPDVVVVELGANDGLRGLPLDLIEENLREIITRSRASGARVILAGMRVPPSYGPEYSEGFHALFGRVAEELEVPLIPFILEEVAGRPALNLPDGIHPTAEGHELLAGTVLPYVEEALPR